MYEFPLFGDEETYITSPVAFFSVLGACIQSDIQDVTKSWRIVDYSVPKSASLGTVEASMRRMMKRFGNQRQFI